MCVVNFHHLYLSLIKRGASTIQELNVRKFADFICHKLSGTNHKRWYTFLRHIIVNSNNFMEHLVHIQGRNGQTNRDSPYIQKKNHKTCGNPFTDKLFICRKYLHRNVKTNYNKTQWWYKLCKLPLCAVNCSIYQTTRQNPCPL